MASHAPAGPAIMLAMQSPITVRLIGAGILAALHVAAPLAAAEPSGIEIARKADKENRAATEVATFEMTIVNAKGKEKVRKLKSWASAPEGQPERAMIRFLDPPDVAGTAVLTIEQPDQEDEQWMYLPALKRTRRIAGAGRNESFMGSDLSYEDLRPREVEAYTYDVLKSEKLPEGEAWVLESRPVKGGKAEGSDYARSVAWIRKSDHVALKLEIYDRKDALLKVIVSKDYQKDGGVMRPSSVEVENKQKGSRTSIRYLERQINAPVDEAIFTTRALETQAP